jgi:apolipoprotein N-acyltransferase
VGPGRFRANLRTYYQQVANTQADVILPETALPVFLDDLPSGYLTMVAGDARRKNMALATGIPRRTRMAVAI